MAINIRDSKAFQEIEVCALLRGRAYDPSMKRDRKSLVDLTKRQCDMKTYSYLNKNSSEYTAKALLFSLNKTNACALSLFMDVEASNASYAITNANFTIVFTK